MKSGQSQRYLTKSRFKLALECPTKLFYTGKDEYANTKNDNEFLAMLADGGFQVGELAKLKYPDGIEIKAKRVDQALAETAVLLREDTVTLFEPAILFDGFLVRVDVLIKRGQVLEVIEVNPQDANAIKVIGLGDSGEYFLGYLPKDVSLQIVKTKCLDAVYGRLVRAYRGTDDYLEIQLQIVGLKAKKSEFDAFAKKLPAQDSHKEYLKYWSIPFDDDLTVGDAELKISEHSSKARLDAKAWEEYITYQNLLDVFDDESQREYFGIQEVPRAVVMATVKAMRDELGSYSEVADDPDAIAQRVLEDHPELALEK